MGKHFERPGRAPLWIAATALCSLVAAGVVAIAPSISAAYANVADNGPSSGAAAAQVESADTEAEPAGAPAALGRRIPACPECGVVASIRQLGRSGAAARQDGVDAGTLRSAPGAASGMAAAVDGGSERGYEITVRFRGGKTAVFNDTYPTSWRVGNRLILISGVDASPG